MLTWRFEAGFDEVFVDHLAEMRMALEPAAAAAAAQNATSDELIELYALAAKFDDPKHTPESIAKVDLDFHGNRPHVWKSVHALGQRFD